MDRNRGSSCITAEGSIPVGIPGLAAVDARRPSENFPVALQLLPGQARADLVAIYGFARLADELGDSYEGDRLAALAWLDRDLDAVPHGRAVHPVVRRLAPTIQRLNLGLDPFHDLIDANRRDQVQTSYESFDELTEYCRLSANPVGRLVLAVFGVSNEHAQVLSDAVCTALQVVEHLQDVGEDARAGRIYLPADDLAEFGCTDADLHRPTAGPELRGVIRFECDRAARLLESGRSLLEMLTGPARLAVAGFVAGGRATLDAIEAADFDVLGRRCTPAKLRTLTHMARLLARRRPARDSDKWSQG